MPNKDLEAARLKASLDAPPRSAYADDPEYIAAAKAFADLDARRKSSGRKSWSRDERRLLARYGAQMDEAAKRAHAAHDAYLRERGLLDSE